MYYLYTTGIQIMLGLFFYYSKLSRWFCNSTAAIRILPSFLCNWILHLVEGSIILSFNIVEIKKTRVVGFRRKTILSIGNQYMYFGSLVVCWQYNEYKLGLSSAKLIASIANPAVKSWFSWALHHTHTYTVKESYCQAQSNPSFSWTGRSLP